jgi:hypothetical protein
LSSFISVEPKNERYLSRVKSYVLTDIKAGELMSCAGGRSAYYPRSAEFVEKMLKGAKPADLPLSSRGSSR